MPQVMWFDVSDLFDDVDREPARREAQRVAIEIYRALERNHGADGPIKFVRHSADHTSLVPVTWDDLCKRFIASRPPASILANPQTTAPHVSGVRRTLRQAVERLPARIQRPLTQFLLLQSRALLALLESARAWRVGRKKTGRVSGAPAIEDHSRFEAAANPGDVFLVIGAPDWSGRHGAIVRRIQTARQMKLALLIHDIHPLRHPQWHDRDIFQACRDWHRDMLPLCDHLLVTSCATGQDMRRYAAHSGIAMNTPVTRIATGSILGADAGGLSGQPAHASPGVELPARGSYVLCAGALEARKNHVLLMRVWRRMTEQRPPDRIPMLVFAGEMGPLVSDLIQQLRNAAFLDGKICVILDPAADDLAALYRDCRFTVSPSLAEGGSLPVSESLAFGKACLASNLASLREAGGDLARYFDPENLPAAYRLICETLDDPATLKAWETRVTTCFRPVSWDQTAAQIVGALAGCETGADGGT